MALSSDQLQEIITELVTRPGHEKVRGLIYKLLTDGLGATSHDIGFEQQTFEIRGRIDALLGRTVIELKSDLRKEVFAEQLSGYLKDRRTVTGQDYVGIVTDGATFSVHELGDGDTLIELGCYTPHPDDPFGLTRWLESVVALQDQLIPDIPRIKVELGRESILYRRALRELRLLWTDIGADPEVAVKRSLWDRLLNTAYGNEIDAPELFLQHTYLVVVAKAIATAAFVRHLPATGEHLLDGRPFSDLGIVGAVESDFFDWLLKAPGGDALVLKIARQAARFDLSAIEADLLKGLYESLIDPAQRHELGEYYTPDWLAARIVEAAVEKPLSDRVIDPSCGSGTFLFHAVRRLAAAGRSAGLAGEEIVSLAAEKIAGIDIHPVAVIFARATWLLAIAPTLSDGRPERFAVPVYLGDALQWHGGDLASEDFEITVPAVTDYTGEDARFGRQLLRFPKGVATNPDALDQLLQQMLGMAERERPLAELQRWMESSPLIDTSDRKILATTYETLAMLHQQGRNHIWGYIARNMSRPVWLAGEAQKADVVVGNPPWVAYSRMDKALKARFKSAMDQFELWGGTGSVSGFDLSAYFFARAMQLYLRRDGRIAFILPYASMFKQPYAKFRTGRFRLAGSIQYVTIDAGWDLTGVDCRPDALFPVPSSVWFGRFAGSKQGLPEKVTAFSGHLARRDAGVEEAASAIAVEEIEWPDADTGKGGSAYRNAFRSGALLYPRRLVLIERMPAGRLGENPHAPRVRGRTGSQDKKPWKDIEPPQGPVESGFISRVYLGENVFPYRIGAPLEGVVPVKSGHVLTSSSAINAGAMHLSQWLEQCEELWSAHGEGTRSFADHLNYFDQLLSQFPLRKLRVVYAKSGTKPAAAIIEDDTAVFDHKLYWAECLTRLEAQYLIAILNSETARSRAEKWQAEGQWGKRDFDKVMFNLPIPTFDSRIALHREIATVAARAEAAAAVATINEGDYFVTVRNRIRKHLTDVGLAPAIDKLVEKLLDGG
jgi:hypothetical protein